MTNNIEKVKLDQQKVCTLLHDKGMTLCKLSKLCGRGTTYVSDIFSKKNSMVSVNFAELMARMLDVELDEIKYQEQKQAVPLVAPIQFDTSEIEKLLSTFADRLEKKMESMQQQFDGMEVELVGIRKLVTSASNNAICIRQEMKALPAFDPVMKAKDLIKDLMKNGYVEEEKVYMAAEEKGISKADIQKAKKQLEIQTTFKGYGRNSKSVWIENNNK